MTKTTVVNYLRSECDVYIGRARDALISKPGIDGYFGNPFYIGPLSRGYAIAQFELYFHRRIKDDAEYKRRIEELRGKRLGCFCKPQKCHGDVIAAYLNGEST